MGWFVKCCSLGRCVSHGRCGPGMHRYVVGVALCINAHTHTSCIDGLTDASSFLCIENYQHGIYLLKNGTYFTPMYILEPNLPTHVQPCEHTWSFSTNVPTHIWL